MLPNFGIKGPFIQFCDRVSALFFVLLNISNHKGYMVSELIMISRFSSSFFLDHQLIVFQPCKFKGDVQYLNAIIDNKLYRK